MKPPLMGDAPGVGMGLGDGLLPLTAPMAPVPGLRDEGNVYLPIQRGGRPMTYMERVEERKAVEEVSGGGEEEEEFILRGGEEGMLGRGGKEEEKK